MSKRYRELTVLNLNDLFNVDFWVGNFFVTTDRRLFASIELIGVDADGLSPNKHLNLARQADKVYSSLDSSITVTQYFISHTDCKVRLKARDFEFSNLLSKNREKFLNAQELTEGRLFQFFEVDLDDSLNSVGLSSLFRTAYKTASNKGAFHNLKSQISHNDSYRLYKTDLNEKISLLKESIKSVQDRWGMVQDSVALSRVSTVAVLRYLSSCISATLVESEDLPARGGGSYLAKGDVKPILKGNVSVLKFEGQEPKFVRMCSITSLGEQPMPGLWASSDLSLGRQAGNYIICFRFSPMSTLQESMFFSSKKRDLGRGALTFSSLFSSDKNSLAEKKDDMPSSVKNKFDELDKAEAYNVNWTKSQCFILIHGRDSKELKNEARMVTNALTETGMKYIWEGIGLVDSYRSFFPTGKNVGIRRLYTNNRQNAAAGLFYRPGEGQRVVKDLSDEAQYIFQTESGRPFYFSPFVGGRGLMIGVGPTRSGKTYLKNSISAHFLKYLGEIVSIDIDPGSEILAKALGEMGSIFNVDGKEGRGFNLFDSSDGPDDSSFVAHITYQLIRMLEANDEPSMTTLADGEQKELDSSIIQTLKLPKDMQTLSNLVAHMPPSLGVKFSRWVQSVNNSSAGKYASFSDCVKDGASDPIKKLHTVYNLKAIKSDQHLLSIAYPEIFYRVIKRFEDLSNRTIPKLLEIDEFHQPLKDKFFAEAIVTGARTWNKYLVSIALWTQSPDELGRIENWDAVRSAASTLFFMSDPDMDDDLYKNTFKITDGECDAIRGLRPRCDAYIIQRDLGVSKKVQLNNDPVMHAIATSHPREAEIRDRFLSEYPFAEGIEKAAIEIANLQIEPADLTNKKSSDHLDLYYS